MSSPAPRAPFHDRRWPSPSHRPEFVVFQNMYCTVQFTWCSRRNWTVFRAQRASKSRSRADQERLRDGFRDPSSKLLLFPLTFREPSTTPIFNLTAKTHVFLKIPTLPFSSRKHIIPSVGDFKKACKIRVRDAPKPFQEALRIQLRLGSASSTGLERFWTPKWRRQASPRGVPKAFRNSFFSH